MTRLNRHDRRAAESKARSGHADLTANPDDDVVLSFPEAAQQVGIALSTLKDEIKRGVGPEVLQLSTRRFGIRKRALRAWLDGRVVRQGGQHEAA